MLILFFVISAPDLTAQKTNTKIISPSLQKPQTEEINDFGTLWGWGRNEEGQIGDGTNDERLVPVQIGKDYKWKIITTNIDNCLAIKADGTLWAWGWNLKGQFGDGTFVSSNIPKRIGNEWSWRYVSAGQTHTLAIKSDSSLWAWGGNDLGALGDSTLVGGKPYPSPIRIEKKWQDFIFVLAGNYSSAVIRKGGTLFIWGRNENGEIGDETNIDKNYPVRIGLQGEWLTVNCGFFHKLAIKKDGTLWAWGLNTYGQLGDWTTKDKNTPVQIGTDSDWLSIAGGHDHSLAIKKNGSLWGWGKNNRGALGDSTIEEVHYPVQIGKDNDWVAISANYTQSTAMKKDGSLWIWGWARYVSLDINYKIPTKVKDVGDVIRISNNPYSNHTMFIRRHIPPLPEVITLPITNLSSSSAESGGNVTSDGKEWDCVRGICYSTTPDPTINDSVTIDGQGSGEYQSTLKYLKPFTIYYVRAYATNSVGTAYGQNEIFGSKLPTPILVSPKNGNYNISLDVALCWKKVELAKSYRVQIYNSSKIISDVNIIDTSFKYDKYEPLNQYDWRVQTINGSDSSDWSEMWSFATSKFYPAQLIKPVNDTINIPIDCELSWKGNIAGSKFNLQFSKNNNFTKPDMDTTLSSTNLQIKNLDLLHLYYWRVRAKEGTDQSAWSPVWKFTTLMDSVNLSSPADKSKFIDIPLNLSWEEGIYKKDYRLQVSDTDDFATASTDTLISKTANADVKNLNYWQKYFWRVRNESGDTLGYWSQIWQFKTRMSDMLLMYPENTQTGLEQEINFKWYPVIGAEYYQLQISKNEQFTNMVYSKDSITTTEHFVPDLEKDILYYWRVRVWNTESIGTAYWSEVWTFRTGETGVKDETALIQIIPNPAGDFITVTIERRGPSSRWTPSSTNVIQIYNTLGEKVMSESIHPMTASHRMNITDLPKGIYFVKVGGETAKFVKL